jgi:signal transduction histidine kinase
MPDTTADELERSRSWWESWLLAFELGDLGAGPRCAASDMTGPRSARDWVVDGVFFGYAVLAAVATAVNDRAEISTTLLVVNCALSAVAALSLWERKRHPLGVAWLTVVLSAVSSATVHTADVAIFSAAIHARPRRAVQATVAAIAALAIDCTIYTRPHEAFASSFFAFWTANAIVALAFGSFIRVRRELVVSLQETTRRVRSEQRLRVREAQLAERARIAREMHDVLAHRISLLSVHAGALEFNPDPSREELVQGLGVIRSSAHAAQEELREVLGVLRTDPGTAEVDPPQPTITDLDRLIAESRRAGMHLTLLDQAAPDRTPPLLASRTVYRVVQEGLTNARKHAPGDTVSISISGEPGGLLEVKVINRPNGASPPQTSPARPGEPVGAGNGLVGLAERVALAGGTLDHRSRLDGGFELVASVPWPATDSEDQ